MEWTLAIIAMIGSIVVAVWYKITNLQHKNEELLNGKVESDLKKIESDTANLDLDASVDAANKYWSDKSKPDSTH